MASPKPDYVPGRITPLLPMADLEIIEHHPQSVMEAFRRGEFDQIEIIGEADERNSSNCACARRYRALEISAALKFR